MARSRSVPSTLFEDPDFFERSSDTQIILIGLVLDADDEGRGNGHSGLLARKLNKEGALVESALAELEQYELVQCYHVGRFRYYQLPRWSQWETLSRPTASKYPAPPCHSRIQTCQDSPDIPQHPTKPPGESWNSLPEEEGEGGRGTRSRRENEGEEAGPNVVPFPTKSADCAAVPLSASQQLILTKQVAEILHLAESASLNRLVQEYGQDATLSLLGEADAAREWIGDRRRNRQGQVMSPAFFRRWLKREQEAIQRRQAESPQASAGSHTGTDDPYERYVQARQAAVAGGSGT